MRGLGDVLDGASDTWGIGQERHTYVYRTSQGHWQPSRALD